MKYDHIFSQYVFVPDKATDYGFAFDKGSYSIRKPLPESGFYAVFRIRGDSFEAKVYEEPDGDEYLPFEVSVLSGGFASTIRSYVDNVVDDVVKNCFALADVKAILLAYVKEKYGTIPEAPWGYLEEYHTLNTAKRHKWYGLFMLIPYQYLGIEKEGKINVLNLKVPPENIPDIIDYIHYFPSYHMNKKYWISILLDRNADIEQIKKLLDESYAIVEGK
ncbi:MAG: MmcQ/YjbR family DNA-binding protein [Ruminococcus sp.]|nr:MmcQ/YjbR family DNA-binding protein [Ruminococcus sp.]